MIEDHENVTGNAARKDLRTCTKEEVFPLWIGGFLVAFHAASKASCSAALASSCKCFWTTSACSTSSAFRCAATAARTASSRFCVATAVALATASRCLRAVAALASASACLCNLLSVLLGEQTFRIK